MVKKNGGEHKSLIFYPIAISLPMREILCLGSLFVMSHHKHCREKSPCLVCHRLQIVDSGLNLNPAYFGRSATIEQSCNRRMTEERMDAELARYRRFNRTSPPENLLVLLLLRSFQQKVMGDQRLLLLHACTAVHL